MAQEETSRVVTLLNIRLWMVFTFVFFTTAAIFSWKENMPWLALFHSVPALFGGIYTLLITSIHIDTDAIWCKTLLGHDGIYWNEIEFIEIGQIGFVFNGKHGRFGILGPSLWSKKEQLESLFFLKSKIYSNNIACYETHRVDYTFFKNAKLGPRNES